MITYTLSKLLTTLVNLISLTFSALPKAYIAVYAKNGNPSDVYVLVYKTRESRFSSMVKLVHKGDELITDKAKIDFYLARHLKDLAFKGERTLTYED